MNDTAYTLIAADRPHLLAGAPISEERLRIARVFDGDGLRVVRLALAAGQVMREHSTNTQLLVQVLWGRVVFRIAGEELDLPEGGLLHVRPAELHEVEAVVDSHLLLTLGR